MKTFTELFNTILTADNEASSKAAREVRRLVYSSGDENKYETIASIVNTAPQKYIKIKENWRQENFVMAISVMYFLGNKREQPDFLFSWLFKLLIHENGNIRQAAVRMYEVELGPLTYHIRFPGEKPSFTMLSREKADYILLDLFNQISNLLRNFWRPQYKKYKYISTLPNGVYKSTQLLLSRLEDLCGEEYINHLQKQIYTSN